MADNVNIKDDVLDKKKNKLISGVASYWLLCYLIDNGNYDNDSFKSIFSNFYQVKWYKKSAEERKACKEKLFEILDECIKKKENIAFCDILKKLSNKTGRAEVSFSSKIMHMAFQEKGKRNIPIYDSIVGKEHFGIDPQTIKNKTGNICAERLNDLSDMYAKYCVSYNSYLKSSEDICDAFKNFVHVNQDEIKNKIKSIIDDKYPNNECFIKEEITKKDILDKISEAKMIDFVLWADKACKINIKSYLKTLD